MTGRLGLWESAPAAQLQTMGPGTKTLPLLIEGNSILSSLFVQAMDLGATIQANWWDSGVGSDVGERYNLNSHPLVAGGAPSTSRIVVTQIHNKPNLEVIVSGGNVTFGVYITVVSSFPQVAAVPSPDVLLPTGSRSSPIAISPTPAITKSAAPREIQYVIGASGPVVMTANPQIAHGAYVGQELVLVGTSNVDTVAIVNGLGLELNGSCVLAASSKIWLVWDGSIWGEVSRNDI